jgi:hypothetical protein
MLVLTLQLLLRVQSCSGARLIYGNGEVGQTPALEVDSYTVIRCEPEAPIHYFLLARRDGRKHRQQQK